MRGTLRVIGLVVAVAAAGALAALGVGALMGMSFGDLAHLLVPLVGSTVVTVAAAVAANAALRTASLRNRFLVVAILGAGVALANLAVMAKLMLVSEHDLAVVMLLVVFAAGTAVALALVLASGSTKAVHRLVEGAQRIGDGELDSAIGDLDAGPELDALARSLDDAAARLRAGPRRRAPRRDHAPGPDRRGLARSADAARELARDGRSGRRRSGRRRPDDPSVRGEMRRSVEQLVGMVDDLFELTQLDAGVIRAETTRASLDDVVRSALATIRPTAERKGSRSSRISTARRARPARRAWCGCCRTCW